MARQWMWSALLIGATMLTSYQHYHPDTIYMAKLYEAKLFSWVYYAYSSLFSHFGAFTFWFDLLTISVDQVPRALSQPLDLLPSLWNSVHNELLDLAGVLNFALFEQGVPNVLRNVTLATSSLSPKSQPFPTIHTPSSFSSNPIPAGNDAFFHPHTGHESAAFLPFEISFLPTIDLGRVCTMAMLHFLTFSPFRAVFFNYETLAVITALPRPFWILQSFRCTRFFSLVYWAKLHGIHNDNPRFSFFLTIFSILIFFYEVLCIPTTTRTCINAYRYMFGIVREALNINGNRNQQEEDDFDERLFHNNNNAENNQDNGNNNNNILLIPSTLRNLNHSQLADFVGVLHDYYKLSKRVLGERFGDRPLRSSFDSLHTPETDEKCLICRDLTADLSFLPCGHRCVCSQCYTEYFCSSSSSSSSSSNSAPYKNCLLCSVPVVICKPSKCLTQEHADRRSLTKTVEEVSKLVSYYHRNPSSLSRLSPIARQRLQEDYGVPFVSEDSS